MQDIRLFESWEDLKIQLSINPLGDYEICYHQTLSGIGYFAILFAERRVPALVCDCLDCGVACMIEMLQPFDSQVALVMTRWLNRGSGIDQNDALWQIRAYGSKGLYEQLDKSQNRAEPRVSFEGNTLESFRKLWSRNLSYLKKEEYKKGKPFIHDIPYIWHIPYKEPTTQEKSLKEWTLGSIWPRLCRKARLRTAECPARKPTEYELAFVELAYNEVNGYF